MAWNNNFSASHIILVTYRDIVHYDDRHSWNNKQTFQVVLASDENSTYVIFNYEDVNLKYPLTGLHVPNICSKFDVDSDLYPSNFDSGSNVNVPGRYIFRLSEKYCPGNFNGYFVQR